MARLTHLTASLLGSLELTLDDQPVSKSATGKARALLAYLAVESDRPHRRETLAGLLWSGYPERSARTNLRNTLSTLRAAIGDRDAGPAQCHLFVTRETIQFNPQSDCWVDVRAFEALLQEGQTSEDWARAVTLYRGPFLEGFSLPDCPAFDDWALVTRERLERQVLEALQRLAKHSEGQGAYTRACDYARRRVELAPWQEQAHRDLMRLLALSGQRGAALAQYEACRRTLREELDVEPGEQTTRLYERIRNGELAPPRQGEDLGAIAVPPEPEALAPRPQPPPPTPPRPSPASIEGQRRVVTALLADVKGSTALAGQIDVEDWVEIMDRVFQVLGAEIYRFGGEVDQYRGDGLVAFFGRAAAHEDDPERAVLAALAMQDAVKRYAAELAQREGIDLSLRVGLNTGEVIAATVGERHHREETAMGRAVALAARMETACEPGTVLASENTYRLVERLFEWQALGEIQAKGFSQPVLAYRPLAHKATTGKGRGIEGLSSPLVGRDRELQALQEAVARLQRGVGGVVTVVGEAGIGKSRLVAEVRTAVGALRTLSGISDEPRLQWVEGRCLSYGGSIAYLPWLDMLRGVLGVARDAPSEVTRDALRAQVGALCPDSFDAVYPYLCRLLSLPLEDAYAALRTLQGESLRAEVFSAVQTLVESAARRQPLVLVCEDLHWADATSLALLERVMALTDRAALLVVCVFRPEVEHPCWQIKEMAARLYRHRHTDLWLEALSADESQALVRHLLLVEDLPQALRAKILDHAEGNPFYAEEIVRTLIDDGTIVYDEQTGHWQARRKIADIPIPDSLHGVLAARIDRLEEETRRVLRQASVIGRVFPYRVLAEIVPSPPTPLPGGEGSGALDMRLLTLQRQQLIRERARVPELEYIFKHELTREAAYNGLLKRERRACHRQVAEALERLYPAQADEQAGLLAHHWERAEEPERAVEYLLKAGEQARLAYANEEAADYYQRALALMDTLVPDVSRERARLTALTGLGKVRFCSGQVAEADGPLWKAIAIGKAVGLAARELVRVYWWLGEVLWWQGRFDDQLRLAKEGLALCGEDTRSVEAALMYHSLAVAHKFKGHPSRAREYMLRSTGVVQGLPYAEELRPVYTAACDMCMLDKKVDETQRWLLDFEDGARRHHDLRALSEMRNEMGILHYEQGKLGQALSEHEQAVDLSRRIGDDRLVAWSLSQLFVTHLAHGALNEAEACIRRWFETTETLGSRIHRALAYGGVGWLSLSQGRLEEAIPPLQQAIELESEGMGSAYEALLTLLLARAHLALGHRRQAREQFHTPAVPSDPTGSDPWLVPVLSTLEQACETPEEFCLLCRRYRAQCPEIQNAPYAQLVGWRLEPADVQADPGTGPDLPLRPSDWDWVDPYGDCSYSADVDLEIHAANGRDMWHVNWSAPRLLRQISGGFSVETTCGPAVDDRPAIGGLLLWRDERNYLHLDRGAYGEREITLTGCVGNEDVVIGRGWLREASGQIYLRLERLGDVVYAYCSADGERWFTVGHVTFPVEDPVQVGLHAIGAIDRTVYRGAYPEGTAIRFASFRLWEPAR